MTIHGLNKTTLLDYPGRVAATVFTGNCNFRCPFCHNAELVLNPDSEPVISIEEFTAFLKKRQGIIEGVCITGGEPTLQPDLFDFIKLIRSFGYPVKLDTNGYRPQVLRQALDEGLLDYVAMDIKSGPTGYKEASGCANLNIDTIRESVELIKNSGIDYEFRTTVVKGIHKDSDFVEIGEWLGEVKAYFIQNYRDNENVMVKGYDSFTDAELEHIKNILLPYIPNVRIRGED